MSDKRYYYLKLKDGFFDGEELKVLESMENGYLFSNILLKFYLKALKNDGKLIFNEFTPYDSTMLSTITGHSKELIEKAINVFKGLGLIEVLDNGSIYMINMQNMIGSITSEAVRKSEYREKIEKEKEKIISVGQCPKNNGTMSQKQWDNVPPYIYNSNYISNTNNIVNTNIEDNNINNSNIHSELVNKFIPPTIEEIVLYAKSKGREDLAHKFYEFYDAGHWVDSQGLIVSNWKQRFISWKNKNDKRIENTTNYKTTDLDRYRRE